MPESMLARFVLLPELKFERISFINKTAFYTYHATKCSDFEVCPKCANPSSKVHRKSFPPPTLKTKKHQS